MSAGETTPRDRVEEALRAILDPEVGANIVDLGLIYALEIRADGVAAVVMTTTSQGCPAADYLCEAVETRLAAVEGVTGVEVTLTWDPPWTPERIVRLD